jgi:hypothetical protein
MNGSAAKNVRRLALSPRVAAYQAIATLRFFDAALFGRFLNAFCRGGQWLYLALDDLAPAAFRQAEIPCCCGLRKLRQIVDILGELVAFVFDRLIRLKRSALVAAKPIDLLADPNQPL